MKKVLIWGTGNIANDYIDNLEELSSITGFIQSKPLNEYYMKKRVFSPDSLPCDYDYIIVANSFSDEIYKVCISNGIDIQKVVFFIRGTESTFNSSSDLREVMGDKNYTNYLAQYNKVEDSFFASDLKKYNSLNHRERFKAKDDELWPVIGDRYTLNTGQGNYFWQDLWAATKIIRSGVKYHYDIGSRIDGFVAHLLASGIRVNVIDIRKIPVEHELLETIIGDATNMEHIGDGCIESLSALCSLEHFGLGRYGDEIDPEACFKAFDAIQRKIKKNGNVYISVPVGRERVEFNAHRIFYASTIISCFSEMELIEYSCAAENRIEKNVDINKYDHSPNNGEYRYGLFHFVKK